MTSILTNQGAMIALQTLQSINSNLLKTNSEISTGMKVATSADNAALWAVATIMRSDVAGFEAISESLSLGKATVSVARNAAEKVTELLNDVKQKIVSAQGENVDRQQIQNDIDNLEGQINSIVAAAQFNGLNLLDGSGTEDFNVLSSLDRTGTGVTASNITVERQDLSANANVGGTVSTTGVTFDDVTTGAVTSNNTVAFDAGTSDLGGEFEIVINGSSIGTYTVANGTTNDTNIASEVKALVDAANIEGLAVNQTGASLDFVNEGTIDDITVVITTLNGQNDMIGGGPSSSATLAAVRTETVESTLASGNVGTIQVANAVATGDTETTTMVFTFADATTTTVSYTAAADDTAVNTAAGLANAISNNAALANAGISASVDAATDDDLINITSTGPEDIDFTLQVTNAGANGTGQTFAWDADGAGGAGVVFTSAAIDNAAGTVYNGSVVASAVDLTLANGTTPTAGEAFALDIRQDLDNDGVRESDETVTFTYFVQEGDTNNDVADGLVQLVRADSRFDNVYMNAKTVTDPTTNDVVIRIDTTGEAADVALTKTTGGTAGGGLALLAGIDVTTNAGANQALADIEQLIQTATAASAAFGSSESRIDIQTEFVGALIDSMNSGIGALVDTNMEEASARLQALQVQQQLATQSLAIANAGPANILALFQ